MTIALPAMCVSVCAITLYAITLYAITLCMPSVCACNYSVCNYCVCAFRDLRKPTHNRHVRASAAFMQARPQNMHVLSPCLVFGHPRRIEETLTELTTVALRAPCPRGRRNTHCNTAQPGKTTLTSVDSALPTLVNLPFPRSTVPQGDDI